MGRFLVVGLLFAGFGGDAPDGRLVLGVAGSEPGSNTVTREWAAVADPRTGAVRKRRLQGGALCYGPVVAIGDRVVFGAPHGRRTLVRALPLTLRGPARSLGTADTFAPSPSHSSVWLGRRWVRHAYARLGLLQVDARARVLVRARIPARRWSLLNAALSDALVVTIADSLVAWDPRRGIPLFSRRGGSFLAASNTRMAWCDSNCLRLHVWSGRAPRRLQLPAGTRPLASPAAFSPDGRTLAIGLTAHGRERVAVVDVLSGRWILVPGGRLGGYDAISWSPSGRWLYFTESNQGLRAWRVGAPSAIDLPIAAGGTIMSVDLAP